MTKILVCDDEGIVRESLTFIIHKNFGNECQVETAKNGRIAIEQAESFRPDIILMDIQMPGINGINAMEDIRRENKNVVFIVLTAYDKFEYSQAAINLGVFSYLTKPINRDELCDILRKAMKQIRERKAKASSDLLVKEKLEAVIPIIESGFIYSVILENNNVSNSVDYGRYQDADYSVPEGISYRELLDIHEEYGCVVVIECGDELQKGNLSNKVGAGIKLQKNYLIFRETIKEMLAAVVGEVMANKVIAITPCKSAEESYDERVLKIEKMRTLLRKLEQQIGLKFKAGIGLVRPWSEMAESYREASEVAHQGVWKVTHAKDMPVSCVYEETYPVEVEKQIFDAVEKGDVKRVKHFSEAFIRWLESCSPQLNNTVRLKVIEFILWAEHLAYMQGGMVYRLDDRRGYLDTLLSLQSYKALGRWFVRKMEEAAVHIAMKHREKTGNVVETAKEYIRAHFTGDLSLEHLAREIDISPYYLSKLFKEIEGVNYIDYVTSLRIEYAKTVLNESGKSIKEICCDVGYSDPNYFSRIFKKWTGVTPTEYREGGVMKKE